MIHAHISKEKAVPLWAVIGALLSLVAPAETAPTGEPWAGFETQQVEAQEADQSEPIARSIRRRG